MSPRYAGALTKDRWSGRNSTVMQLTREGEYAIRAMIYLARQAPEKMVLISEIADAAQVPQALLAKTFQKFSKMGILRSTRGLGGGFTLGRSASRITLLQIVEAVEGPILPSRCLSGEGTCERDRTCGAHRVWRSVQQQVVSILGGATLEELALQMESDLVSAAIPDFIHP